MTIEERLKDLIIKKYGSAKNFTESIGLPNSTLANILRRGLNNANVTNVIKICQALEISTDALAEGRIEAVAPKDTTPSSIEGILDDTKNQLLNAEHLTLDGHPATTTDVLSIINALDVALEIGKRNKEWQKK